MRDLNMTLAVGQHSPSPVPQWVIEALESVEVTEQDDCASGTTGGSCCSRISENGKSSCRRSRSHSQARIRSAS